MELSADFPKATPGAVLDSATRPFAQPTDQGSQVTEKRGWRGILGKVFRNPSDSEAVPSQPPALTTSQISELTLKNRNPRAQLIEAAMKTGSGYTPDLAHPAGEINEPLAAGYSVISDQRGAVPLVSAQEAANEQAQAAATKASHDAAIAHVALSKVDEVVDSATIKPERPGIGERIGGALREGIGRRSAGAREAVVSVKENRAGEAAIQATLRTIATKPADQLITTATNADYRTALAKSYVRNAGKGAAEITTNTYVTPAEAA